MDLPIYRPNKDKTKGFAVQFKKYSNKRGLPCLRIEAAQQIGEKPAPGSKESPFDWEHKIVMSIDLNEIGELMAVTQRRQDEAKLFHEFTDLQQKTRTTSLQAQWTEFQGKKNLAFKMGQKNDEGVRNIQLFLSQGEAALWQEMMSLIVREYYLARIQRSN